MSTCMPDHWILTVAHGICPAGLDEPCDDARTAVDCVCCVIDLEEAGATLDELAHCSGQELCSPAVAASYEQAAYTSNVRHITRVLLHVSQRLVLALAHACARSAR
jgi:hypothetical protein